MNFNPKFSKLTSGRDSLETYWIEKKAEPEDPRFRIIEAMRRKMMLLSYLLRAPRKMGLEPWTPFLDPMLAMAMLNLPDEDRENRRWQVEYFLHKGLMVEPHLDFPKSSLKNSLNLQGQKALPISPLNIELLEEIIDPNILGQINQVMDLIPKYPTFDNLDAPTQGKLNGAYGATVVLKALEILIQQRDA